MHHIFADCGLGGGMETSLWTHCVGLADGHFGLCLHFEQDKFLRVRVTGQTIWGLAPLPCYLSFCFGECHEHCKILFVSAFTRGNRIRHSGKHDMGTSETVNSNSVRCKYRWSASRLVVGHLCTAAHSQDWSLTAQESCHHSLQRRATTQLRINWMKRCVRKPGTIAVFSHDQHGLKALN